MVASFGCILMQALPATAFIIYYFFFILYLCSAPFILIYGGKQKKWCRAEKPNPQGLPEGVPSVRRVVRFIRYVLFFLVLR